MTETPAETISRAAVLMRSRAEAATKGPWWCDESENCWRLHGVAFEIPPQTFPDGEVQIPEQVVNSQILKAPKHGTPYAEYWPGEADAAQITSWANPLVALAVADWLDRFADTVYCYGPREFDSALAIACAYLGEKVPA